jgi:peptidyl-prolyl cis-trans isomerase SurA
MKFFTLLASACLQTLLAQPAPPQNKLPIGPVEVNGIAATVNGRSVTKKEVSIMLAPIASQLIAQFPRRGPEFEKQMRETHQKIVQELIDRELVLYEFKDKGGRLPPSAINEEVERQKRDLYNGNLDRFMEDLRRSNLSMTGFRDMTHDKLVVQAMRASKFASVAPPLPAELREEYEKIKLNLRDTNGDQLTYHKIYIPAVDERNPLATPDTQLVLAEDIVKKLKAGGDFIALAKEHSRDSHAEVGGLHEKIPRTDLQPEFAALIMDPPEGTIIGPLFDAYGLTIVKVKEKKYGPVPPFESVKEQLEQRVSRQKNSERYERWIESLRKKAMIKMK